MHKEKQITTAPGGLMLFVFLAIFAISIVFLVQGIRA